MARPTDDELFARLGPEGYLRREMRLARRRFRRILSIQKYVRPADIPYDQRDEFYRRQRDLESAIEMLDHRKHRKSTLADLTNTLDAVDNLLDSPAR